MEYKYKISVIMPIYNSANYLRKAINSVIKQSIGFKNNIQLILINDGSQDDSEKICIEFKNKFPNNIIYEYKTNEGVCKARNYGLQFVEGKYVNFFDSDDLWSKNSFKKVYEALENNNDVNIASCRVKFFDAKKGSTTIN